MRAEVVAGYDRIERENLDDYDEYPHEYPFMLITVIPEPTGGSESRVASYIEYNGMGDRESRLFVKRSPPGMGWLGKVFDLIRETDSRGIVSRGLQEIRIGCEDKIELMEDRAGLIDHESGKVYFDNGSAGKAMDLSERREDN